MFDGNPVGREVVLFSPELSAPRSKADPDYPILRLRPKFVPSRRILPPSGPYVRARHSHPASQKKHNDAFKVKKRNRQGSFTYGDGGKYIGEYKNGNRSGQGAYTFANGNNYVGEFIDGKFNGQGTATDADGNKYVGEFKNGKFHGQGTATDTDGRMKEGIWKNGMFLYQKPSPIFTAPQSSHQSSPNTQALGWIGPDRRRPRPARPQKMMF